MAGRNQNLAYNLSYIEQENNNLQKRIAEKERFRKKEAETKKSAASFLAIVKCVSMVCVVVFMLGLVLVNYVQLTEKTAKIVSTKKELAQLQEQKNLLNVYIERKTNVRQVEQFARDTLGMAEVQNHQIEYISLGNRDKIEVLKVDSGNTSGFLSVIARNLNVFTEYLWQ